MRANRPSGGPLGQPEPYCKALRLRNQGGSYKERHTYGKTNPDLKYTDRGMQY